MFGVLNRLVVHSTQESATVVEEYFAFPRRGVTHVEAALNLGVETTVGKGAAPVLVNVESNEVLFSIQLDEFLLLIGQLDVFAVVPAVGIVDVTLVVCPFAFVTGLLEHEHAVDVVFAGSIIVTASQEDRAGKQLVGRECATHIDVGHDAVASPLIGRLSSPCCVAAEGSCVLFPVNGRVFTSLLIPYVEVDISFFPIHVEARLIPLSAFCVRPGTILFSKRVYAANDVVVGILVVPLSIFLLRVVNPCPCRPLNVVVIIRRRQQNYICADGNKTVSCAGHQ